VFASEIAKTEETIGKETLTTLRQLLKPLLFTMMMEDKVTHHHHKVTHHHSLLEPMGLLTLQVWLLCNQDNSLLNLVILPLLDINSQDTHSQVILNSLQLTEKPLKSEDPKIYY